MSLTVFLADGHAVVRNGLNFGCEKFVVAPASCRCGCTS